MLLTAITSGLLLTLASAAAMPALERRGNSCHFRLTGTNREGGGGPGQTNINQNFFEIAMTGSPTEFTASVNPTSNPGIFDLIIPASDYGETDEQRYQLGVHAQWSYLNNSWNTCTLVVNNQSPVEGGKSMKIKTGYVSDSIGYCDWYFDC